MDPVPGATVLPVKPRAAPGARAPHGVSFTGRQKKKKKKAGCVRHVINSQMVPLPPEVTADNLPFTTVLRSPERLREK